METERKSISRRELLKLAGIGGVGMLLGLGGGAGLALSQSTAGTSKPANAGM